MIELRRSFTFDAAHYLPNVGPDHKCSRMHGHTYTVEIVLRGDVDEEYGWLVDLGDIKDAWQPLHMTLDHSVLNTTIENPTSELLAMWIWDRLQIVFPELYAVGVSETAATGVVYYGPA